MQPCPYCSGSGMVKSVATVCSEIYDEVHKLAADMRGQRLVLRVNPEVARALGADEAPLLKAVAGLVRRRGHAAGRPAPAPGAVRRGGRCDGRAGPARDQELVVYVEAIEGVLRAHRGASTSSRPATSRSPAAGTRPACRWRRCWWRSTPRSHADPALSSLAGVRRRVDEVASLGPRPAGTPRESRARQPARGRADAGGAEGAPARAAGQGRRAGAGRARGGGRPGGGGVAAQLGLPALPPAPRGRPGRHRRPGGPGAMPMPTGSGSEATRAAERHRGRVDPRSLEEAVSRLAAPARPRGSCSCPASASTESAAPASGGSPGAVGGATRSGAACGVVRISSSPSAGGAADGAGAATGGAAPVGRARGGGRAGGSNASIRLPSGIGPVSWSGTSRTCSEICAFLRRSVM